MTQAKVSQKNSNETVDLSVHGAMSSLYQCPQCDKKALAQLGSKFDCIWCDFSREMNPKKRKPSSPGTSEGGFWFLLILTIIVVLLFHAGN